MTDRRQFLKDLAVIGAAAVAAPAVMGSTRDELTDEQKAKIAADADNDSFWLVEKNKGLKITGTFLDEISHDIPHQNWGVKEWDMDFQHMKAIWIDTIIIIIS